MPRGYEKMRDKFIADGMSPAAAKAKAARIWNAKHPENPVTRKEHEEFATEPLRVATKCKDKKKEKDA